MVGPGPSVFSRPCGLVRRSPSGLRLLLLAAALLVAWPSLPAAAAEPMDTLTLTDGRTVQGQVVSEGADGVKIVVAGVERSFSRDLVAKVSYGGDGAQPAHVGPGAAPEGAAADGDALAADLSYQYQVPRSSVEWARRQGITDADLPQVFAVAADAQVRLKPVVDLRLQGWSWPDIRAHFGLQDAPPAPAPRPHVEVEVSGPVPVPPPFILFRILFWPFLLLTHHR